MRLRQLRLECYGNFADAALELDDRPGRINLIVAPNGAGKSVLRRAVSELLFGIHPQTPMNFRYEYNRMRLVTTVAFADDPAVAFVRRKGSTNTLTNADGKPVHPSIPNRLPREAERKRLERLFMLDSATLREGGKALLQTDGDLADALLSSAGDLGSARTLAADLAARRDKFAPKRKTDSTPFHAAGKDWTAATNVLAGSLARPAAVDEQERLRTEAVAARDAANAAGSAARAELARLARVRSTRRHLQSFDSATAWLDEHPAPPLPPEAGTRLTEAKRSLAEAERVAVAAAHLVETNAAELARQAMADPVLAEADAIEQLTASLSQSAASRVDLPKRERERDEARAAIGRLLRELSSACDPAAAASEVRAAADVAAARALIADAAEIASAHTAVAGEAATAAERLAEAEDELAALPATTDTEALQSIVAEAVADGDPVRLAQAAARATAEAAASLAAELARVPGHASATGLAELAVVSEPTFARLDRALTQALAAAAAAARRQVELGVALAAEQARLADLTGIRPLPDAAAIAAARADRDRGWALVYARLEGHPKPDAEAVYAPGIPLPIAFERAIATADAVADRHAEEATRLAAATELQTAIARQHVALAESLANSGRASVAVQAAEADWAAALAPTTLPGGATLAEVQAFLAAREQVIAARQAECGAQDAARVLAARQETAAAALAAALQTAPDTLVRLLNAGKARITAAERAVAQRQASARTIATARRAAAQSAVKLQTAQAASAAWAAQWDACLGRLRRPAAEPPAITAAVLDRLVALPARIDAAESLQGRVSEMTAQLAGFTTACQGVAARLGEAAEEPEPLVRRLGQRLTAAREANTLRAALQVQAAKALEQQRTATAGLAQAQAALQAAITGAGGTTLDQAETSVALAADRVAQDGVRAEARARLDEDGDGRDLDTLRAETAATPPDAIADAKLCAEAAESAAQQSAQDAAAQQERAEGALRRLASGQDAARAANDRQAAAARMARVLEDALVQHLAATMLEHGLQEVEAIGSANHRLERIGETFRRLTGSAYTRLSPGGDGKNSAEFGRIVAHEAGGAEKHIAELSEGTRDQLYLALRLIAVEDHVQNAPALPFVADDILQTSDDVRARAALEALVGLSQHVQVILLTHHPHLLAVAQGLPVHRVSLPA